VTDNSTNTYEVLRQQRDAYHKICETIHKENKARLFDFLDKTTIQSIHVEFNGASDSGQIEEIRFIPEGSEASLVNRGIEIAFVSQNNLPTVNYKVLPFKDCIEQLCYNFLEEKEAGWELNEGAFGEFLFDVEQRTITLDYNQRIEDVVYSSYSF